MIGYPYRVGAFAGWMRGTVVFGTMTARTDAYIAPGLTFRYTLQPMRGRHTHWGSLALADYGTVDAFDKAACRWWAGLI